MVKHALLSPSSAGRWLTCTRAPRFEEPFENIETSYAHEGTVAHAVAELVVRYWHGDIPDDQYESELAELSKDEAYTEEMVEHAITYAKVILEKAKALENPDLQLEVKLDISKYAKGCFGTGDCVLIGDGVLEIVDYKYGKGHRVDAKENPQMRLYALGALEYFSLLYEVETVRMTIVQPRLQDGISSDETTKADLLAWGKSYVKPRAALAYAGKGEFAPSAEACRFCRARRMCKARAEANLEVAGSEVLSIEEAAEALNKAGDLRAWLSDLESLVFDKLAGGQEVPGWKIVAGRSNRAYTNEPEIAKTLAENGYTDIYDKKLKGITAMERMLGKPRFQELLGDYVIKPEGKPTLAPESDRRPAIMTLESVQNAFEGE